jgi:hypothetical protein
MKEAAAAAPNLAINGDTMTDVKNITNFQAEFKKPDDKFYLRFWFLFVGHISKTARFAASQCL